MHLSTAGIYAILWHKEWERNKGDVRMADFMVGWNTYPNGMNQDYRPGYPATDGTVQNGRKTGEMDALSGNRKTQEEEQAGKDSLRGKEPGEECQTCKNRKYKDGSNENVSFKAASHISPEAAASRVRAHEGKHVANAYSKAAQKGGEVLSVSVRLETAVCPECGKNYVSGGTTSTRIRYPADSREAENQKAQRNPYAENQKQVRANAVRGKGFDYATKPLEEFETERY